MRFKDRVEFQYDPAIFSLKPDTDTALRIHSEYIVKHSPQQPIPTFLEVDRRAERFDHLWHVPLDDRTAFSRVITMPVIIQQQKPSWKLTRIGIVPIQQVKVWMGNLLLQENDWWPVRGDFMIWNGYRHMLIDVTIDPSGYWHQTNVWLGLVCTAVIPPEGDARPLVNPSEVAPGELKQTRPLPEV